MHRLLFVLVLMLASTSPALAIDRTTYLLELLDSCDQRALASTGPRLDLLLALADGRSAADVAWLLRDPRRCIGRVSAYGEGIDEIVLVGGPSSTTGAILWVDRGYWRIASAPLGYWPGTTGPVPRPDGREYLIGIGSGGSAGTIGLAAVTISGAHARTTLSFMPGGEIGGGVHLLPDGRLYIEGRTTSDRALTWSTHPDWPGGAQWLFERRQGVWVEVAHRQVIHPHYLATGLIGGLRQGNGAVMSRFASAAVVADALALSLPRQGYIDMHGSYAALVADGRLTKQEMDSWDALPDPVAEPPSQALYRTITFPGPGNVPGQQVELRFDRDASGWRISWIRLVFPAPSRTNELVP